MWIGKETSEYPTIRDQSGQHVSNENVRGNSCRYRQLTSLLCSCRAQFVGEVQRRKITGPVSATSTSSAFYVHLTGKKVDLRVARHSPRTVLQVTQKTVWTITGRQEAITMCWTVHDR